MNEQTVIASIVIAALLSAFAAVKVCSLWRGWQE